MHRIDKMRRNKQTEHIWMQDQDPKIRKPLTQVAHGKKRRMRGGKRLLNVFGNYDATIPKQYGYGKGKKLQLPQYGGLYGGIVGYAPVKKKLTVIPGMVVHSSI